MWRHKQGSFIHLLILRFFLRLNMAKYGSKCKTYKALFFSVPKNMTLCKGMNIFNKEENALELPICNIKSCWNFKNVQMSDLLIYLISSDFSKYWKCLYPATANLKRKGNVLAVSIFICNLQYSKRRKCIRLFVIGY